MACLLVASSAYAQPDVFGEGDGDSITVTAREAASVEAAAAAIDPALRLTEYRRAEMCGITTAVPTTPLNGPCASRALSVRAPNCDGRTAILPLWRRDRDTPTSAWSWWRMAVGWSCPEDAPPVFTGADFARLPITPSTLTVQPARAEVLVNIDTITYTDPTPEILTTTLLGYPIEVEATPATFTWDYGDGSDPVATTSPGHPYPDHDVAHTYTWPGTYTITLTTTFTGRYRLIGTIAWLPVDGTATTTTTTPITAAEARSHLVAGDCTQTPTPPDC